jgi:enoyl-[acyl-carrier protein] reductase II
MAGIEYPIVLGGMLVFGKAELAAAVSVAGGLGLVGAGAMGEGELRNEPVRSSRAETLVEIAVRERVPVVSTSAGDPFRFTERLKDAGILVLHVVPTVAHATRAERAGVDAIVAEGVESGGYINPEEVTTVALVPQVVDAVNVPVIAAGGIADARGLVAALALGAVGVQLGTRFLATHECDLPEDYKSAILLARDTDTTVVRGKRAAHRDLKADLVQRVIGGEGNPTRETEEIVARFEQGKTDQPREQGRRWAGRSAGQSAGLIREVLTVKQVVDGFIGESREILASLPGRLL